MLDPAIESNRFGTSFEYLKIGKVEITCDGQSSKYFPKKVQKCLSLTVHIYLYLFVCFSIFTNNLAITRY